VSPFLLSYRGADSKGKRPRNEGIGCARERQGKTSGLLIRLGGPNGRKKREAALWELQGIDLKNVEDSARSNRGSRGE